MKFVDASGRWATSWIPNCELNNKLEKKYGTSDIHAFRYYLQQNAEQVMQDLQVTKDACKSCPACGLALAYRPTGGKLIQNNCSN
jgi:hypothetical protein